VLVFNWCKLETFI